jgi:hypothetical protein
MPEMRHWLLVLPLLSLSVLGARRLGAVAADSWGARIGRALSESASQLPHPAPAASIDPMPELEPELPFEPPTVDSELARPSRPGKHRSPTPAGGAVFVPQSAVLRLAEARVMPRAVPVPARGKRPAGLRLIGVGALGIGMRDGDVLTEVLGTPVSSTGQVIQMVIQARGRRERVISGKFYRGEVPLNVVVEQPYIEAPTTQSKSSVAP